MLKRIDAFLNSITMYRLVVYLLGAMILYSFGLSFLGYVNFTPLEALISFVVLYESCKLSNLLFSWILSAPRNVESSTITSFILFLIIEPTARFSDLKYLVLAGILATSSKYILAWKRKHIFNPVAISLFVLGLMGFGGGIWWAGSKEMLPIVLLALLIVRKIRKEEMFFTFLSFAILTILSVGFWNSENLSDLLLQVLLSWPLLFFGGVMLTEPLTSPGRRKWQIVFGGLVGLLFGSRFSFGPVFSTPELALIVGNILAFLVNNRSRLTLKLKKIEKLSPTILEFVFSSDTKISYEPGQYAELTLPHSPYDDRGNRRYFTIASSPKDPDVRFGLRVDKTRSSSFKLAIQNLKVDSKVYLTQIGGDFVLPEDKLEKLILVAGGVGITPFTSMVRHLLTFKERRDIILFYLVKSLEDFVYRDVFKQAEKELGLKLVLIVSDTGSRFDENILKKEAPDFIERTIYISGSNQMVQGCEETIKTCGVGSSKIRTDFFPGY